MSYRTLSSIFHEKNAAAQAAELAARRASSAAVRWPYRVGEDEAFAVVTEEIAAVLKGVREREGEIAALWGELSPSVREQWVVELVVEEMRATNEIEGVCAEREELVEVVRVAAGGGAGRRFLGMARLYLAVGSAVCGAGSAVRFPQSLEEVRELYDELVGAEISEGDAPDGRLFRGASVVISDGARTVHAGAASEAEIEAGLQVMVDSAASEGTVPEVYAACVEHFMFEYTHPFYDGNGRLGRFLLSLRLAEVWGSPTALVVSAGLCAQRRRYYKAFAEAEKPLNRGELTHFVADMVGMIAAAQEDFLDSLARCGGVVG